MQEQIKVTVSSGAATSTLARFSRCFPMYGIQVGTMSTGAVVGVNVSTDAGTTYYQVFQGPNVQTATVTNAAIQIGSSVGTNGGYVVVQGGYKDVVLVTTAVVSGGVSFNIIGFDG